MLRVERPKDVFNPSVLNVRRVQGVASYLTSYQQTVCLRRHPIDLKKPNATPLIVDPKLFINLGPKPLKKLWSVERPQIVNNFAPRRVNRHELTPPSPLKTNNRRVSGG
jgi:hypothetical protein